ncbi:mCG1027707, partial [Mus musculus]
SRTQIASQTFASALPPAAAGSPQTLSTPAATEELGHTSALRREQCQSAVCKTAQGSLALRMSFFRCYVLKAETSKEDASVSQTDNRVPVGQKEHLVTLAHGSCHGGSWELPHDQFIFNNNNNSLHSLQEIKALLLTTTRSRRQILMVIYNGKITAA